MCPSYYAGSVSAGKRAGNWMRVADADGLRNQRRQVYGLEGQIQRGGFQCEGKGGFPRLTQRVICGMAWIGCGGFNGDFIKPKVA